jgi:hypothetical protein
VIESVPLAIALSAVYILTGVHALHRWARTISGTLPSARRTVELAPLLLSVAMLSMTWTRIGSAGVVLQVLLFTVLAGYFGLDAVRRHRPGAHDQVGDLTRALMAAAMVWMLVAMPWIMPRWEPSDHGHGEHVAPMGGAVASNLVASNMGAQDGAAGWVVMVTAGVCAVLLAGSVFWGTRAVRGVPVDSGQPLAEHASLRPDEPADGTEAVLGPAAVPTAQATATATEIPAPQPLIGSRADAVCEALMGWP